MWIMAGKKLNADGCWHRWCDDEHMEPLLLARLFNPSTIPKLYAIEYSECTYSFWKLNTTWINNFLLLLGNLLTCQAKNEDYIQGFRILWCILMIEKCNFQCYDKIDKILISLVTFSNPEWYEIDIYQCVLQSVLFLIFKISLVWLNLKEDWFMTNKVFINFSYV